MMTVTRRSRTATAIMIAGLLAAACGSTSAGGAGSAPPAPPASLPLATSLGGPGQPGWAVVAMGGSAASHENFWELFARPGGSTQWRLVTPAGVASNGGLLIATAGAGLLAGFAPSQDLRFSPLAAITTPTGAWTQNTSPVSPGLAREPDALASDSTGSLLALTSAGTVLRGAESGATWTRLTSLRALAATPAAQSCGLAALTAVAFAADGAPLIAGRCTRKGAVAVFRSVPGGWRSTGPALPAWIAADRITVLGLTTQAGRTTAVLEAQARRSASAVVAWLPAGASGWTLSPPAGLGNGTPRSADLWPGGGAALVLPDGTGQTIAGPGTAWQSLPALPRQTATLALGPAGQFQALAVAGDRLTIWQLAAATAEWRAAQQITVQIPYGSSG